jgi:hypothetical protein
MEITRDHLPFFLWPAVVKEASLAFTGMPENAPGIGEVEFDGQSLSVPTEDEQIGGLSIPLSSSGAVPWKHRISVASLHADTRVWLLLRFGVEES